MSTIYLGIVIFLILLAIFDIAVGVSNDAVNFINSAIGSKAATFRTIIIVAAIGVFTGASLSNGMMDIARHGIFTPSYFSFEEVMCIFLAVVVTDVVLLDIFNSMGMPTSTTVSMVFELLGGAFAISMLKVMGDSSLSLGILLNTDKAFQVIIAIFMSVAVAFVFGWIVQYITRIIFTFTYSKGARIRQGVFAGLSLTAIVYFLLINGLKGSSLMTPQLKAFIDGNTMEIVAGCFALFTLLMTVLTLLKVNVLRIVVLAGTFALAMAFAGNDLVNFIGVTLAGISSYQDFVANGSGDASTFMMTSLMESAKTPIFYLIGAGIIMVVALTTSKKAHNVVKTSVDLARQDEGDEMFGSSHGARSLVRNTLAVTKTVCRFTPTPLRHYIGTRFNVQEAELKDGAAFDLLRAAVNLVLAGLLVALGTSFKLPLSTTYVTFMVAMGSSLADRAWTRESAVFRITGVLSVIGGWFITAGVAFIFASIVCATMYYGGITLMLAFIVLAVFLLIRSNIKYAKKAKQKDELNEIFRELASLPQPRPGSADTAQIYNEAHRLIARHSKLSNIEILDFVRYEFRQMADAFFNDDYNSIKHSYSHLEDERKRWKRIRRREIIGMRRIDPMVAIEKNTWFFLANNAASQMIYCLKRLSEPLIEHLGNRFSPLPQEVYMSYTAISEEIYPLFGRTITMLQDDDFTLADDIRRDAQQLQARLSSLRKQHIDTMTAHSQGNGASNAELVYINIIQETQELIGSLRHLIRGLARLRQ
ncbi:MAG: inorganic phosphate transporter [Bacteroidaceae bacterium]|nr:inorganic phosphate transporter [Bacteroidaceae bacterium]